LSDGLFEAPDDDVGRVVRFAGRAPPKPPVHAGLGVGTAVAFRTGQEDTKMKTNNKMISALVMVSALAFGSATAQAAGGAKRGQVSVSGAAVKAVVVGPVAIHAYSAFSGGTVYAAPAVTGTDADCNAQPLGGTSTTLRADSVVDIHVGAGQIACLATNTVRPFELLWHASKDAPAAAPTMLARR
jgi:hypothetical protein